MKFTEETREKMRQAKLKNPTKYWLGKKRPELKLTNSAKTMFKKGMTFPRKGKKYPEKSGENHFNWKGGLPKCEECGKELGAYKDKNHKSQFCKQHKGIYFRGANHWNWKGDKYTNNYRERRRFRFELQKKIFERDDYTCQFCGTRGGALQVDHIQSWAEYVELRFSINNCRTLCMDCHYKITFGKSKPKEIKTWGHNFKRRILS